MDERIYYILGLWVAENMLSGHIQPDLKIDNIGQSEKGPVFVDSADMFECCIPDDLDEKLLLQLTESIFSFIRSVNDRSKISCFRAGFTARGGILADIVWHNLANKGFYYISYMGISNGKLRYEAVDAISLGITKKIILQWENISLDEVLIQRIPTLTAYIQSEIRTATSSYCLPYLDRLYFTKCFEVFRETEPEQLPTIIMNMGMSALRSENRYTAYGLLNKAVNMPKCNNITKKMCEKALNKLVHTKRLSMEIKDQILSKTDYDLFDFLWLLDDLDTFEEQLCF